MLFLIRIGQLLLQFKIAVYSVLFFLIENVPAYVGVLDHISIWGGGGDFIVTQICLIYLIECNLV